MKYIAIDELNHFTFHDAELLKIEMHEGNMIFLLSAVNATIQNSQNSFDKDMCIKEVEFIFKDFHIVKIEFGAYKVHNSNRVLINSVESRTANPDEYYDILKNALNENCYVYSMEELSRDEDETHLVCFLINANIYFTFSFSKSIAQWNEYNGIAWYEMRKK